MDVYAHEKEQIEGIKAWWRENRWYIVGGLVVAALAVGGWRMWLEHQQQRAEAASLKYEDVITRAATGEIDALHALVTELQAEFDGTPYAALATLKLAAAEVETGNYDGAADALRWVVENTADNELALVARLRLGRVHFEQDALADVHRVLDVSRAGKFEPLFEELRGDAFLAAGDRDNARAAYEASLAAMEPGADTRGVQMKIDNLAMPIDALLGDAGNAAAAQDSREQGE